MQPIEAIGETKVGPTIVNSWPIVVLVLLGAMALLWGLDQYSLRPWDEVVYAQASKEMVQSGDWLTLHYEYKPWFDEAPLLVWLTAFFYKLFGINEFWSRAASAFSGFSLVLLTYLVGKFIYDQWTGFISAVVLLTSFHFLHYGRSGMTDIMLALFILLAVYAYLRLEKGNQKWWYLACVSCALALMVKSLAGLVAPATIALSLWLDGRLISTTRSRHFWVGLVLAFVIVAPWHIIMYLKHGRPFIDGYLIFHFAHATTALQQNVGDRFFYVNQLQAGFYPWFYLVPFALALNIKENIACQSRSRILLLVVILEFGLYTLARTKLPWYILPLYPPLAALTAFTIIQAFRSHESVAFAGLGVGTVVVALLAPRNMVFAFACAGMLLITLSLFFQRTLIFRLAAAIVCVFLLTVAVGHILPLYERGEESVAKLARMAESRNPDDREPLIVFSGISSPTPLFYSNRPIQEGRTEEDLAKFTQDHQPKRIIMGKKDLMSLSGGYEIQLRAEAGPLVYATIRLKEE